MKLLRKTAIETAEVMIGDQIDLGSGYSATCQLITDNGALFYFDQYLDYMAPMNSRQTNQGGYGASDLRVWLQLPENSIDLVPVGIRPLLGQFENSDVFRLATAGEIFGKCKYAEPDNDEQWPLMKSPRNRVGAYRSGEWDWGWLQNKRRRSKTDFCFVNSYGSVFYTNAFRPLGVRPAFLIKLS